MAFASCFLRFCVSLIEAHFFIAFFQKMWYNNECQTK